MSSLEIINLSASINGTEILKGLTLSVPKGEVHAIMGPNGSGKSTLAKVMAGHEDYDVTSGDVLLNGTSLLDMEVDERSRQGLFLAFQYPAEIPGVSNANFLRAARQARLPEGEEIDAVGFYKELYSKMDQLGMDRILQEEREMKGFQAVRRRGMRFFK